jgi:hypothetical protein
VKTLPEQESIPADLHRGPDEYAATLVDRPPVPRHLDPAAALAFRTPIQDHVASADGKAAGVLTLLGLMFTVLARLGSTLSEVLATPTPMRWVTAALLAGFAVSTAATIVQMFRTISPKFPPAKPSLAFFGDIARLSREDYIRQVTALSPDEALRQMVAYNHTAAQILVLKFQKLNSGLKSFKLAAAWWLPLAVYLVIHAL